eukprot:2815974-Pyramimonas_sp.AAC.1
MNLARQAELIFASETHLGQRQGDDAAGKLVKAGWHAFALPAVGCEPGLPGSGGLLTLVPARHGLGFVEDGRTDMVAPGRASMSCHGAVAVNVYLHAGQGMSPDNVSLLLDIAERVRCIGKPFTIGGDFNATPQELQEA